MLFVADGVRVGDGGNGVNGGDRGGGGGEFRTLSIQKSYKNKIKKIPWW